MIEITANSIQVIVTGGDHNLGGKNWDDEIIKYLASCFNEETGLDEDILEDPETRGELQLRAESAKKR
jgi:molecular chaperone DnaK